MLKPLTRALISYQKEREKINKNQIFENVCRHFAFRDEAREQYQLVGVFLNASFLHISQKLSITQRNSELNIITK